MGGATRPRRQRRLASESGPRRRPARQPPALVADFLPDALDQFQLDDDEQVFGYAMHVIAHRRAREAPGHGVDIDEELAAKCPYNPAYLPVARLEDGTMWNG